MASFLKFLGFYSGMGAVASAHQWYISSEYLNNLELLEATEEEVMAIRKLFTSVTFPLWPVELYYTVRYESTPYRFADMTDEQREFEVLSFKIYNEVRREYISLRKEGGDVIGSALVAVATLVEPKNEKIINRFLELDEKTTKSRWA